MTHAVVRRAPFSDNPRVGARGQRTQQRILDAALGVFAKVGYHECSIDAIAKRAGCSRVSFYQYFAGKEDVFRELAGQVARQAQAAIESLGPVTPDADGRQALRDWVGRTARIYERYEPVFRAFDAASEADEVVALKSARWGERHVARFRSGVTATTLPPRRLDPLITMLMETQHQTLDVAGILRAAAPDVYTCDRVEDAITDVMHRSLFGLRPGVNRRARTGPRPPRIDFEPATWELLGKRDGASESTTGKRNARNALMLAGRDVFLDRGYHRTRVDDLVVAAGVSHGAFYRYFKNKDELARILTLQATRSVATVFGAVPGAAAVVGPAGRAALRRWLRRYNETHVNEAAMLRVSLDAALHDARFEADAAAAYDWGRRRMARFLEPRGFGDVDVEALLMVTLLGAFGARRRTAATVDAAAHIIEQGLLGR